MESWLATHHILNVFLRMHLHVPKGNQGNGTTAVRRQGLTDSAVASFASASICLSSAQRDSFSMYNEMLHSILLQLVTIFSLVTPTGLDDLHSSRGIYLPALSRPIHQLRPEKKFPNMQQGHSCLHNLITS